MSDVISPAVAAGSGAADGVLEADYRDWIALLKPRVLTLVVFTGVIGMLVAPGHLNPVLAFTAILCITVAAGACGARMVGGGFGGSAIVLADSDRARETLFGDPEPVAWETVARVLLNLDEFITRE